MPTPHQRSGAAMREVTPHPRPGVVAGRSYPTPQAQGQGQRLGGDTPRPRPGAAARRSNPRPRPGAPTPRPRSCGCGGAGGPRGAIHVEGQEGRFAGAAVKRYPTSKVRETQVRWLVLQEGIRGQAH